MKQNDVKAYFGVHMIYVLYAEFTRASVKERGTFKRAKRNTQCIIL